MVKKHVVDCTEGLWKQVLKYKLDRNFKSNNLAVTDLLVEGLKRRGCYEKEVGGGLK